MRYSEAKINPPGAVQTFDSQKLNYVPRRRPYFRSLLFLSASSSKSPRHNHHHHHRASSTIWSIHSARLRHPLLSSLPFPNQQQPRARLPHWGQSLRQLLLPALSSAKSFPSSSLCNIFLSRELHKNPTLLFPLRRYPISATRI